LVTGGSGFRAKHQVDSVTFGVDLATPQVDFASGVGVVLGVKHATRRVGSHVGAASGVDLHPATRYRGRSEGWDPLWRHRIGCHYNRRSDEPRRPCDCCRRRRGRRDLLPGRGCGRCCHPHPRCCSYPLCCRCKPQPEELVGPLDSEIASCAEN
ncbi:hypothetical protein CT0861_03969, partial [Colletotrichum tofieldiae]